MTFIAFMIAMMSCAPPPRMATSQLDTPDHHFATGMRLLNQGKYADAQREFELAIELNPKYSKAYAGIGLVKAYKKNTQKPSILWIGPGSTRVRMMRNCWFM